MLMDSSLDKVDKLKEFGYSKELMQIFGIIDLLIEWLRSCKSTKKI
jgi:hypothetical protein